MTDPPRHACHGQPMVCPGPCNPLKAHHHNHHRRHRRQKPDITGIDMSKPNIPLPDEFSQIMLRSLKVDSFVTSTASTDVIIEQILSPKKLREPPKPRIENTDASKLLIKVEPPETTRMTSRPEETAVTTPDQAPRCLNNVTRAITTRLRELTSKEASPGFLRLTILLIYAGIFVLLAVIAGRTPAYQFFVSSQICGIVVFLMWRLTGTILI